MHTGKKECANLQRVANEHVSHVLSQKLVYAIAQKRLEDGTVVFQWDVVTGGRRRMQVALNVAKATFADWALTIARWRDTSFFRRSVVGSLQDLHQP